MESNSWRQIHHPHRNSSLISAHPYAMKRSFVLCAVIHRCVSSFCQYIPEIVLCVVVSKHACVQHLGLWKEYFKMHNFWGEQVKHETPILVCIKMLAILPLSRALGSSETMYVLVAECIWNKWLVYLLWICTDQQVILMGIARSLLLGSCSLGLDSMHGFWRFTCTAKLALGPIHMGCHHLGKGHIRIQGYSPKMRGAVTMESRVKFYQCTR